MQVIEESENKTATESKVPPPPQYKDVVKTRKKTLKQSMPVTETASTFKAMSLDSLKVSS